MDPACFVSLGMYEWQRCGFVYHTNTDARVNSGDSRPLQHYMNTNLQV